MWLFDDLVVDQPVTEDIKSSSLATDDGSFLIISETPATSEISEIKAEDIPDSAISFFNEEPKAGIVSESVSSESLKIEDIVISSEVPVTSESITDDVQPEVLEDVIISFDESANEPKEEILIENEQPSVDTASFMWQSYVWGDLWGQPSADPYAILSRAIADLEGLLSGYESAKSEKMTKVEKINEQIAELKQQAKRETEEAKEIANEEEKVKKMIEVFNAQKK